MNLSLRLLPSFLGSIIGTSFPVSLETEDRMTALVANLPIKRTLTGEIEFKKNYDTPKKK